MYSVRAFIYRERILLLLLFIVLLNPFYYGYRIAILFFFLVLFQSKKYLTLIDKNVAYLFLFAASYEILAAMRIDAINTTLVSFLPNIFIPALLYLAGKRITSKYSSSDIRIFFLFFIAFSFSIVPIVSILFQIIQDGMSVGNRSMYLLWDKNVDIAATGLGSYFTINMGTFALINIKKKTKLQKRINFGIILLFILSLVCVVRLGNRTQLAIALISFILAFYINFYRQSTLRNILMICFVGIAAYYIYNLFNINSTLLNFYQDRLNDSEYGISSAGGRSERWIGSFNAIFTDPSGWEFARFGYAHNLWLDVARVSGIIPLLIILLFTISSIKIVFRTFRLLKDDLFLRTYIFCTFLSIILVFNVEPVLDGLYLLFLFFCLFVGFLSGIIKRKVDK